MQRSALPILVGCALLVGTAWAAPASINLSHLNQLTETVSVHGHDMALLHIYANAPTYTYVDAPGEGIACVDDAARAAVVYLKYFERYRDPDALQRARRLLEFVLYLQAGDGQYYNFVTDRRGTINRTGRTSRKDAGWWAARGQWALACGYATFRTRDRAFAGRLQSHYRLGESALRARIGTSGFIGRAGDLTGLVVVGLCEYQRNAANPRTRAMIETLSNALSRYRLGDASTPPFGVHPDTTYAPYRWHAWGSHQVQGLAAAAALLQRPDWLASAQAEADDFYAPMLASDMVSSMDPLPSCDHQIAYGTSIMVSGLLELARATGDPHYARLAGVAGSWFGLWNRAGAPLYDGRTGRAYDGVDGSKINHNAGAESTIETLWALLQLQDSPEALRYASGGPEGPPPARWQIVNADRPRGEVTFDFATSDTGEDDLYLVCQYPRGLSVTLDGRPFRVRGTSPRPDWPWMDPVGDVPLRLSPGRHHVVTHATGRTTVQALCIRPDYFSRAFRLEDGTRWTLDSKGILSLSR